MGNAVDRESIAYAIRQTLDSVPEDDDAFDELVSEFISHYMDWLP